MNKLCPSGTPAGEYRFNHEGCPAGEDTKRRLYIKVLHKDRSVRVAYCHNCGGSNISHLQTNQYEHKSCSNLYGSYTAESLSNDGINTPLNEYGKEYIDPRHSELLQKANTEFEEWPAEAHHILNKAGITKEHCVKYKIGFDTRHERLVYPCIRQDGKVNYMQYRAVYGGQEPKYFSRTARGEGLKVEPMRRNEESQPDTLVIVEDLLSAIRIVENPLLSHTHALPLMGTNIPTELWYKAALEYNNIIVWLDNDSAIVNEQAENICRTLSSVGRAKVFYETSVADPKLYPDGAINVQLTGTLAKKQYKEDE